MHTVPGLSVLTVIRARNVVDKDGNTETNEETLVENILIDPAVRDLLKVKVQELEQLASQTTET